MSFNNLFFILCLSLAFPFVADSQSRITTTLRFDVIANGIFQSSPEYDTRSTEKNFIIPGPSAAIGAEFGYRLKKEKNTKLNLSLLTEYRSFTRFVENQYSNNYERQEKRKFRSLYLTIPLEIEATTGNFTIKGGIVGALNLRTKVNYTICNRSPGESCEKWEYYNFTDIIGKEFIGSNYFFSELVETTRYLDLQYTIGFKQRLNNRISIGGEFRNFLLKNKINYTYFDYDVVGVEEIRQQTNSIHLSLYYAMN